MEGAWRHLNPPALVESKRARGRPGPGPRTRLMGLKNCKLVRLLVSRFSRSGSMWSASQQPLGSSGKKCQQDRAVNVHQFSSAMWRNTNLKSRRRWRNGSSLPVPDFVDRVHLHVWQGAPALTEFAVERMHSCDVVGVSGMISMQLLPAIAKVSRILEAQPGEFLLSLLVTRQRMRCEDN